MDKKKRILSLDLIKGLACLLVIFLHVSSPFFYQDSSVVSHTYFSQVLYYVGTPAVPLFFMVNGFLLINKRSINYKYIFRKMFSILVPVLAWNGVLFVLYFLVGKGKNLFELILGSLIQKGLFFQFWFLGALMLVLLLVPLFNKLLKISRIAYLIILMIFLIICVSIDFLNHMYFDAPLQMNIIQTFRIWTWITYYLIGGFMGYIFHTRVYKRSITISVFLL